MNMSEQHPLSGWNQQLLSGVEEVRRSRSNGGTLSPRAERMMTLMPSISERKREIERYDIDRSLVNRLIKR
jgi:hypothetical protein